MLRDKEVSQLIQDKELLKLIRLFAVVAINLGAQVAPFWLAFCYPPLHGFILASSSLLWKFTLGALPVVLTDKFIWLGDIVYVIALEPLFQIGTALVGVSLVLGHRVVWIVRIVSRPLTWCVVHVTQESPFEVYQAKRATIRAIAIIVYWVSVAIERIANIVMISCLLVSAVTMTKPGKSAWNMVNDTMVQPARARIKDWFLVEDRQLRTRRILAILWPLLVFCLTCPPAKSAPVSRLQLQ